MGFINKLENVAKDLENFANKINPTKEIRCPRCGSTEYIYAAKGYSKGKGLFGAAIIGNAGLAFGASKNKIICACKNCAKKWEV